MGAALVSCLSVCHSVLGYDTVAPLSAPSPYCACVDFVSPHSWYVIPETYYAPARKPLLEPEARDDRAKIQYDAD